MTKPTTTSKPVQGFGARAAALELLGGVFLEQRMMSELVSTPPFTDLPPSERATAQRLATAALRHAARADAMLKPFVKRPPSPVIQQILRLGVVELVLDGQAPHGVVNAAVSLAKQMHPSSAGLVNAVLRKVAEADRALWENATPQRLPGWLRGRLSSTYGNARAGRIEAAQAAVPPLDLTLKDPTHASEWAQTLNAQVLPTGSLRLSSHGQVSAMAGYETGDWWVQDAAAALPATLVDLPRGARVLDLCAAPGGKTLQLAAAGYDVTALDLSGPRLKRLSENLSRTGLTAEIVTDDALHWTTDAPFDAVLLDAPCSATGTIRRHPDLPFVKTADSLKPLFTLQADLFDKALTLLKPDGILVYCTCSLLPDEGEAQLAAALERHPDLTLLPPPAHLPEDWHAKGGGLRLTPDMWPETGGLDGFFIAAFRRSQA